MLNKFSIPPMITSICCLLLALFVISRNKKSSTHLSFGFFGISLFIWQFFEAIFLSIHSYDQALFFCKISYVGVILLPFCHLNFILEFLKVHRRKIIIIPFFMFGLWCIFVLFKTNLFVSSARKYFFGYYPIAGPFHKIYLISVPFSAITAFIFLFKTYVKSSDANIKNRIKYLLLAYIAFPISSVDFFANYNVDIYPFGHIFVTMFLAFNTYAIIRHQLMDIEVIIKKTLIYSILISIITILYFIVIYILERIFSIMIGYQSIALAIIIIAFFSIIFIPLKNKIQRTIDRYFFKGTIDQIEQEKKLLEGELQKNERLKTVSTLAAGMAHEIKNPLTSIKTFAEYLEKKYNDPAFRSKFKNIVPKEIDKISKIINQLLDYSKVDKVSLKACNINSILDYVLDLYNNEFLKKHIKIQKSFNSQSPNITCDENQMKQAFINIVLNSIEAMPKGGELTIRTSDIDNILEVSIKDTGIGIPSDKLKYLFDPFYTTKQKGTGLGLFIVHQIIENNKGKIVIDTEIGKGTTIKIMFVR